MDRDRDEQRGEQQRDDPLGQALLEGGAHHDTPDGGQPDEQSVVDVDVAVEALEGGRRRGDDRDRGERGARRLALLVGEPQDQQRDDHDAPADPEQPGEEPRHGPHQPELRGPVPQHARHTRAVSAALTLAEALEVVRADPSRSAILLDVDGTLAPVGRPAADAPAPEVTRIQLIALSRRYALVACVSGRRAATARRMVSIGSIAYGGKPRAAIPPP